MERERRDLTPYIHSHYLNGIPSSEMTQSPQIRRRLDDLFKLYDMYIENPLMNIKQCLKWHFKHDDRMIKEDEVYFDYIRTNFQRMTRQKAIDLVNWSAEKVMRDAAATNDKKGMLDASKVLIKVNQLDKPEPEVEDKSLRPQSWVYTPYVEVLDPDRKTIKDKGLLQIMKQYDAHIDKREEMILEKVEAMKNSEPQAEAHYANTDETDLTDE